MNYSEISVFELKEYLKIDDDTEDKLLKTILTGAKMFIKSYTGLNEDDLNKYDDMVIVLFSICAEMYDNRQFTVTKSEINPVMKMILNMYSVNYL